MISTLLNAMKYVPKSVALKALSKVSPSLRNYFSSSVAYGLDANAALDYLYKRFSDDPMEELEKKPTPTPEEKVAMQSAKRANQPFDLAKNIAGFGLGALAASKGKQPENAESPQQPAKMLQQQQNLQQPPLSSPQAKFSAFSNNFPNLSRFIQKGMDRGLSLEDTVSSLRNIGSLQPEIMSAEKKTNMDLESILRYIFGDDIPSSKSQPYQTSSTNKDILLKNLQKIERMRMRKPIG